MAHPSLDGLSLHDEEEEGFSFDFDDEEEEQVDLRWCLVGRFICERVIHFNSMRVRMADLWKPVKGVTIKEATAGKFLFHFAHPLDMEAVLNGGPWSFDNNMLLLEQVQIGMQVDQIPLFHVNLWVQVHNLPMGLMKEKYGIQLANYIGAFMEYDKNNNSSFWRQYMRLRVKVDVRQPLKKSTKVKNKEGVWCDVKFKYEKLGVFCFVCGVMGHAENKCEVRFSMGHDDGRREWSNEIRAEPRRQGGRLVSRWLREEKGGREEQGGEDRAAQPQSPAGNPSMGPTVAEVALRTRQNFCDNSDPTTQKLLTQPNHLTPNYSAATNNLFPIITNQCGPSQKTDLTTQPSTNVNTSMIPSFMLADNINNLVPPIYDAWTSQQNNPISINYPLTENNKTKSLPNNYLTFTSQPVIKAQSHLSHPVKKQPRGPSHKTHTRTNNNHDIIRPTLPDPTINQIRTENKKPKFDLTKLNPTQYPSDPASTQKKEDMEVQEEKKRRREEESSDVTENNEESEHFLTAGPGSQDCRDK
jgi:hypothetical protein